MRVLSLLTSAFRNDFVEVEFHSRFQIPGFQILGLPAPEIQEAKERIVAAFSAADLEFPKKKVIINLAPASIKKSGTGHDLAIALKIVSETLEHPLPETTFAWGELGLAGEIKPAGKIARLLEILIEKSDQPSPLLVLTAEDATNLKTLLRWRNRQGLEFPKDLKVQIVSEMKDLAYPLQGESLDLKTEERAEKNAPSPKFDDLHSNKPFPPTLLPLSPQVERILTLGLIGKHHVLLLGPKGVGKSESIRWFEALLPNPAPEQTWQRLLMLESRNLPFDFSPSVRRVHSSIKPAHLLGTFAEQGYLPGELALAHGGLLVADEFVEWPRDAKECLREPLQAKRVYLTRVRGQMECPSDFQLLATGNLCACGGLPPQFRTTLTKKRFACRCRPIDAIRYLEKISGPIFDRIDLTLIVTDHQREKTAPIQVEKLRQRVARARLFAEKEFGAIPSDLTPTYLEKKMENYPIFEKLFEDVTSLRSRHKILRVAHSIQALEQTKELKEEYIFEAKWYRLRG